MKLRSGHRRPWWLILLVFSALIALTAGPAALPAAAQTNLLTNGDFSTGSTAGWTCSSGDSVVSSPTYDGASYALAGTPSDSDYAQCSQPVSVAPDSDYTLTGWVEGDYVYLGENGTGTADSDDWTPSATSWTRSSRTSAAGACSAWPGGCRPPAGQKTPRGSSAPGAGSASIPCRSWPAN